MVKIKIVSSQNTLEKEKNKYFKYNLGVDQKAFYFDEGAEMFCKSISMDGLNKGIKFDSDTFNFIEKFLEKDKDVSLVSLGCGSGIREKILLNIAEEKGYDIKFYGVDSSFQMIEKAQENLNEMKTSCELIYADFSEENFFKELNSTIDKKSQKVFAFLGATLGNVPQNYIADKLNNMVNSDDILIIEVRGTEKLDDLASNKYFKKYLFNITDEDEINFLYAPLQKLGIDIDKGKLMLNMNREDAIKDLVFKFGFKVNQNMKFKLNNEKITLLEGDYIKLFEIRVYELKALKKFFEIRNFKCLGFQMLNEDLLQIAFKKL